MPQQEFSLKPRVITRTEPTSLGYVGECIVKGSGHGAGPDPVCQPS